MVQHRNGDLRFRTIGIEVAVIARYKKLFRSSPETAIFAVYGMIHLILLLAAAEVEEVKSLLHALGMR
jgi:hypothetical protein